MGERLVVKVEREDVLLATLYYHWSAYTTSSIEILKSIYNHVLVNANQMSDDEIRLALIRFAEHSTAMGYVEDLSTLNVIRDEKISQLDQNERNVDFMINMILNQTQSHGGISGDDKEFIQTLFPHEIFIFENVSRNEGLVSLSEKSMQGSISWAESLATIDLSEEKVENGTFYIYSNEEYIEHLAELEEEELDDSVVEIEDIAEVPIDVSYFDLEDMNAVYDIIRSNAKNGYVKHGCTIFEYI